MINPTPARVPAPQAFLRFQATVDLVGRMHDNRVRQQVGALEIVSGLVDEDDVTSRVTIVIDPATGASYVASWVNA
jgi:hypothetical protein